MSRTNEHRTPRYDRGTRDPRELKPNSFSAAIFANSGTADSLDSVKEYYLRFGSLSPILVRHDSTIILGEREWRAAIDLGLPSVDVLVATHDIPDDDIRSYVVQWFAAQRQFPVEVRVAMFKAAKTELQARYGRKPGRPRKDLPLRENVLTPPEIEDRAAKMAHLGSSTTAFKACYVFDRGNEELKAAVNNGERSIANAYAELTRDRPRTARRPIAVGMGPDTVVACTAVDSERTVAPVEATVDNLVSLLIDAIQMEGVTGHFAEPILLLLAAAAGVSISVEFGAEESEL